MKAKKDRRPVAENEKFITLIQVSRDDPELRQALKSILSLNDFNRKSFLNTHLEELKFKKAPKGFIDALSCLLDDDVARQALEIIKGEEAGRGT